MAEDVVLYEVSDGIATITFNRPDRLNAWTNALGVAYFDRLDDAADDPDVRAIVVTGAGRGFCAGADMDMLQGRDDGGERTTRLQIYPTTIPKPIIGAINGACAGLGFVHAMLCDVRFAAAGAKLTSSFSRRGLIAEHSVSWTLPRLIGTGRAMDVLLSGRVILAEEAYEMGLVNKVVAPDALIETARAYAADLAANCSPSAMATIKRQLWGDWDKRMEDALHEANRLMGEFLAAPDFKEGVASFVEKRPPAFQPVTR